MITLVLCFTASAYTEPGTDTSYSVFEVVCLFDRSSIEQDMGLTALAVFKIAFSGYFSFFLPIVVAFPFMVSFCAERNSGEMRVLIARSGRLKYYTGKFVSAFLCGGLSVTIGTILFGIMVFFMFPAGVEDDAALIIAKQLLAAFLCGAVSSMPAFFISSFCKNPYIITCLPFILAYIRDTAVGKVLNFAGMNGDMVMFDRFYPYLTSALPDFVTSAGYDMRSAKTFGINAMIVVLSFAGFVLVMNRRKDLGA